MRIGPLRHRVDIQEKSTTQDAAGEESQAYTNIATNPHVWAAVTPSSAQERFISGSDQQQATVSHRVVVRYRTDLSVEMRVVWDNKNLDIEEIRDPSGKRQYLALMCREVAQ